MSCCGRVTSGPAEDLSTAPDRAAPKVGGNNFDGASQTAESQNPHKMPLKIKRLEHKRHNFCWRFGF